MSTTYLRVVHLPGSLIGNGVYADGLTPKTRTWGEQNGPFLRNTET